MAVNERYGRLIARCKGLPPVRMAIVYPCDRISIESTLEASRLGLIVPVLIGPETLIRSAAREASIDLAGLEIVPAGSAPDAAERAVELARSGSINALMKGCLHSDELLHAVASPASGLLTGRRMSHVFVMDIPAYAHPLLLTDAVVNVAPTLDEKRDIVQNAIDLAHVLGITEPYVAILAAVETVNAKMPATIDAAALCKMADRKQITGGVLDGPLAFDDAISAEAAQKKGIVSPVPGRANILVVPDLESGNMLYKESTLLAGADAAGIVLGARVPIALTSRADSVRTHVASAAVALLLSASTPQR